MSLVTELAHHRNSTGLRRGTRALRCFALRAIQPQRQKCRRRAAVCRPASAGVFSFEAVPWSAVLGAGLGSLRANLLFTELVMQSLYPQRSNADLISWLALGSIAGGFWTLVPTAGLLVVRCGPGHRKERDNVSAARPGLPDASSRADGSVARGRFCCICSGIAKPSSRKPPSGERIERCRALLKSVRVRGTASERPRLDWFNWSTKKSQRARLGLLSLPECGSGSAQYTSPCWARTPTTQASTHQRRTRSRLPPPGRRPEQRGSAQASRTQSQSQPASPPHRRR